jgi:ParB-like chromosome segregation protein Spo0J
MSEPEINLPNPEVVPTSSLKVDGKNPNKMSHEQLDRLKTSIKKFGFIVPIITNKDLLIADGEQRWIAANELAMKEVLIIRLPVAEVDRRLLRQVLNKLHGEHDRTLDAEEFQEIISLGAEKDLKYLLCLSDDKLDGYLKEEEPIGYEKTFELKIKCKDEIDQQTKYLKLTQEGYDCVPLTL